MLNQNINAIINHFTLLVFDMSYIYSLDSEQ